MEDVRVWREQLLKVVSVVVAITGLPIAIILALQDSFGGPQSHIGLVAVAGFACLATGRPRDFGLRARILVGMGLGLQLITGIFGGFTIGFVICGLSAIIFSGIMIGARAAFWAWSLSVFIALSVPFVYQQPWLRELHVPVLVNPLELALGFRFASAYFVGSSVLAVATVLVMARMMRALEQARQRLEDLERVRAEKAEQVRSSAAAREQARESKKIELVSRLGAGIAHDFNNVLQTVAGWAEILSVDGSKATVEEAASELELACKHASHLTRKLLDMSKASSGTAVPRNLARTLESMMPSLRRLLPSDTTHDLQIDEEIWSRVDEVGLQQVVLNLVINARDAMSPGGHLIIRLSRKGESAEVALIDDGVGMTAETQAKMFDPFFTTKADGRGTGLGMSTSRDIVRSFGGDIEVDSHPGVGTCVKLTLPVCAAQSDSESEVEGELSPHPGYKILLVEDFLPVRRNAVRMLEHLGFSVHADASVDDALESLEQTHFDIIITDAVMPGRPVSELIEDARGRDPERPIVLCSGYVGDELSRRGIGLEQVHRLTKPFMRADLIEVLNAAMLEIRDAQARRRRGGLRIVS